MALYFLLLSVMIIMSSAADDPDYGCNLSCKALMANNGVASPENVTACGYACIFYNRCINGIVKTMVDGSSDCLQKCVNSCTEKYDTNMDLKVSCLAGCNAQHLQKQNSESDAVEAGGSSQGPESMEDAASTGLGIGQDKTQNISLNLQGNIETDVKARGFLGPRIKKNDVLTKGGKTLTDSSIAFDLQGEITNDTITEATIAEHGRGKRLSYGKKGKETSQNTSLNIQGLVSHNGSYIDVASVYKPIIKKKIKKLEQMQANGSTKVQQKSLTDKQKKKLKKLKALLSKKEKEEKLVMNSEKSNKPEKKEI